MSTKLPPRSSSVELRKRLEGGWVVGVVAKRTYRVVGERCELDPEQVSLVEEPDMDESGQLTHDSDRILQRRQVDVVVLGHARSLERRPAFEVAVVLGPERRTLAVFGERRLERTRTGQLALSPPVALEKVPLTWSHAYGGVDRTLLEKLGDPLVELAAAFGTRLGPEQTSYAYPRNPHGRGYLLEASPEALAATALPHLENPAALLTGDNILRPDPELWPLAPPPAATAWLPYVYFPRACQVGLPTPLYSRDHIQAADFAEVRDGLLQARALVKGAPITERVDTASAQGAAPGMRFADVSPGMHVSLSNVHPQRSVWRWQLPSERPRLAIRLKGGQPDELAAQIRSLVIEPDLDRVSIVWVGERSLEPPLTPEQLAKVDYGLKWEPAPAVEPRG